MLAHTGEYGGLEVAIASMTRLRSRALPWTIASATSLWRTTKTANHRDQSAD